MIALVPRHGTKNPILGVLAHGLNRELRGFLMTIIEVTINRESRTAKSVEQKFCKHPRAAVTDVFYIFLASSTVTCVYLEPVQRALAKESYFRVI